MNQNQCLSRVLQVLTAVYRPPIERLSGDRVWIERFLRDLDDLLWAHLRLVLSPVLRVDGRLVCDLDVQAHFVALARNYHARAVVGVDRAFVPDVWKVSFWDHVDDAPYEIL